MKRLLTLFVTFLSLSAWANTTLTNLTVQHSKSPNAIEDRHPLFSWQMKSDEQSQRQSAYQILVVRESDNRIVWDSKRRESNQSIDIEYQGIALQPEMGYTWKLKVWDKDGKELSESDRFETGLMSTKESAWNGAQWIGTTKMSLDAASETMYSIKSDFQIKKGSIASFIIGANDFRLNNSFLNGYGLSGENYIRIDLDFSTSASPAGTTMKIYRVGYAYGDSAEKPILTLNKETFPESNLAEILPSGSEKQKHTFELTVEVGSIRFYIDGKDVLKELPKARQSYGSLAAAPAYIERGNATHFLLNPWGDGGDYPSFPNLNNVGFVAVPGSQVVYSDYQILKEGMSRDRVAFRGEDFDFGASKNVKIQGSDIVVTGQKAGDDVLLYADPSYGGNTMLRTVFSAEKKIRKAKLYATAMGVYRLFINGQRVGDDYFSPGDSQYRETMCYRAYDVTSQLQSGDNVLGAVLSGGWYTGYMTYTTNSMNFFGDHEALMARLVITYEDGSKQIVVTDPETWKACNDGPVMFGSFFHGERYDANRESLVKGWNTASYDASSWVKPEVIEKREWIDFDLMARYDEPVKLRETLTAQKIMPVNSKDKHTYIYNMGVNMVGVPQISIPAGYLQKGDTVRFAYAEQLYPGLPGDKQEYIDRFNKPGRDVAGHLQFETNRAALDVDFYVASGSEAVVYEPQSTYRGYQYIQITLPSHEGPLALDNVKGLVLSSSEIPSGTYYSETSDGKTGQLINQLFKNIQRSQLGNFFTIPTDCPQRNERMGWTGDAQAYTRTGIYNASVQNFYRQWMVALRADQGVGSDTDVPGGIGSTVPTYVLADDTSFPDGTTWAGAVCMVPWQMYQQYGDKRIIEENIETMMNWLNGMSFYPMSDEYPHLSAKASGLADWLAFDSRTTSEICNNAIYIYLMGVTAKMADAIGRSDYAETLRERYDLAKAEWNKAYVNPVNGKTKSPNGKTMHSQASYATPLAFGVFNEEYRPKAEAYLAELTRDPRKSGLTKEEEEAEKDIPEPFNMLAFMTGPVDRSVFKPYTITTGFSGTPNILPALSNGGYHEEAYRLISSTAFPSWLYPVTEGATSMWERWNSYDTAFSEKTQNNMNSFNHFALGAVGQWMYEYQLGITSDSQPGINGSVSAPGYQHFVLQPTAGGDFTSLSGSYESNYGTISVSWKADGKGNITNYSVTVPANTTATLYLPVSNPDKDTVMHLGRPCRRIELESGRYEF